LSRNPYELRTPTPFGPKRRNNRALRATPSSQNIPLNLTEGVDFPMKRITRLGTLTAAAAAATGLLAAPAVAHPQEHGLDRFAHAVFVQTDEVGGNHVVAYREAPDGHLTYANTYATGGNGGVLPTSVIDHTASQGAVAYDRAHRLLYVVNAGSNTVSVFAVRGTRLHLRQVVASGGTFPVSITVHRDLVYVANAQLGGSIQGYVVRHGRLLRVADWNRPLGLDGTKTAFTQTPGQVTFTPDGRSLLVTTKANTNSIDVFAVDETGAPAAQAVHNVRDGAVPFALEFAPNGDVVSADVGTASVTTLRLQADGTLTQLSNVPTGQRGTCWVIRDGQYLFTTNPGGPSVSTLALHANSAPTVLGSTVTDPGTVDPAVSHDGRFLYVETGASGILDEFRVEADGSLTAIGSVTVADAAGAEGIATT
jgi:6-phosphogluconolactonase (cycloisomerase 2 family)